MLSEVVVLAESCVLLVQQRVKRGGLVWNFPGGGVEEHETIEEACVREAMEETGYEVTLVDLIRKQPDKFTFYGIITQSQIPSPVRDQDIVQVDWVPLLDTERIDDVVRDTLRFASSKGYW